MLLRFIDLNGGCTGSSMPPDLHGGDEEAEEDGDREEDAQDEALAGVMEGLRRLAVGDQGAGPLWGQHESYLSQIEGGPMRRDE